MMSHSSIRLTAVFIFVIVFPLCVGQANAEWPKWIADSSVQTVAWAAVDDDANKSGDKKQPEKANAEKTSAEKTTAEKAAAEKAAEKVLGRNADRLARLGKPLIDVRIEATSGDRKTPESIAWELLGDQAEITIQSSGASIPLPHRYPFAFYHRPLYFEELNLERCGNTYGCATNAVSGIHLLTNTTMLPYRLATQRADCPVKSHGDCQSCQAFPYDIEPFGFEPRGVLVEAAVAAGFVFLLM